MEAWLCHRLACDLGQVTCPLWASVPTTPSIEEMAISSLPRVGKSLGKKLEVEMISFPVRAADFTSA